MTPAAVSIWSGLAWVAGAYLAGSIPTTYLVARTRGGRGVVEAARRDRSETDAHILLAARLGVGWSALAAALDVAKGLTYPLVARALGDLSPGWVAACGVAVVLGHGWPPWARHMAGRGLAATAGVLLGLLPLEMAVAGTVIAAGVALRVTGLASTVGLATVLVLSAIRGRPPPLVAMAAAILILVVLRRLEGASGAAARSSWPRALYARAVWDRDRAGRPSPADRKA